LKFLLFTSEGLNLNLDCNKLKFSTANKYFFSSEWELAILINRKEKIAMVTKKTNDTNN